MMTGIVIYGLAAILAAALAGFIAGWKNRDYSFWMAWCFIVPPLVLWLLLMPKRQGPRPRRPSLDDLDRAEQRDNLI
jgi:4-amino-4-deoxy-L-arabinose transferase-like glycosyltransferase